MALLTARLDRPREMNGPSIEEELLGEGGLPGVRVTDDGECPPRLDVAGDGRAGVHIGASNGRERRRGCDNDGGSARRASALRQSAQRHSDRRGGELRTFSRSSMCPPISAAHPREGAGVDRAARAHVVADDVGSRRSACVVEVDLLHAEIADAVAPVVCLFRSDIGGSFRLGMSRSYPKQQNTPQPRAPPAPARR